MSSFIRVYGPDPAKKNQKTHQHIHPGIICKAIPVYAAEKDGKWWECTPGYPEAKLKSYRLIDTNGVQYSCGNLIELERLGLVVHDHNKGKIGFVQGGGKKQELELVDEKSV